MTNRQKNKDVISAVTWVGSIANILLAASKFGVGFWIGSQTLIADAVHSLSDLVSDAALLIGLHFWSAPPDEDHPYGHERIETLTTAFIGFLLGIAAIGIAYHAITSIYYNSPSAAQNISPWVIIFVLLVIGVKEGLYWITIFAAKRIGSSALHANAWHHRSDALSSVPTLIAIVISSIKPEWVFVDAIGAIVVSTMLFYVAARIAIGALSKLTDRQAPIDICQCIYEQSIKVEGVKDAHAIRARHFGSSYIADLHIEVDPQMTVENAYNISRAVQNTIKQNCHSVIESIIHIEPAKQSDAEKKSASAREDKRN